MNRAPSSGSYELTNAQHRPDKASVFVGGLFMDVFAIEFIGLMMIALCLAVLAGPSGRRPSRRVRDY